MTKQYFEEAKVLAEEKHELQKPSENHLNDPSEIGEYLNELPEVKYDRDGPEKKQKMLDGAIILAAINGDTKAIEDVGKVDGYTPQKGVYEYAYVAAMSYGNEKSLNFLEKEYAIGATEERISNALSAAVDLKKPDVVISLMKREDVQPDRESLSHAFAYAYAERNAEILNVLKENGFEANQADYDRALIMSAASGQKQSIKTIFRDNEISDEVIGQAIVKSLEHMNETDYSQYVSRETESGFDQLVTSKKAVGYALAYAVSEGKEDNITALSSYMQNQMYLSDGTPEHAQWKEAFLDAERFAADKGDLRSQKKISTLRKDSGVELDDEKAHWQDIRERLVDGKAKSYIDKGIDTTEKVASKSHNLMMRIEKSTADQKTKINQANFAADVAEAMIGQLNSSQSAKPQRTNPTQKQKPQRTRDTTRSL